MKAVVQIRQFWRVKMRGRILYEDLNFTGGPNSISYMELYLAGVLTQKQRLFMRAALFCLFSRNTAGVECVYNRNKKIAPKNCQKTGKLI